MSGLWRTAEAWYCERPGEAIDEGAASVEAPGLEGSWREVETWHLKRTQKKLLVK
ncbi:hypothetical protein STEG23_017855, partial [Scotinomys teguina]